MTIKTLEVGPQKTNCYLLVDDVSKNTLIIDPGDEADFITSSILENKLSPVAILLTHGHYDHCLGVLELKLNFNLPIYLHQSDLFLYQKAHSSAKHFSKINIPHLPPVDSFLTDKQIISFGESSIRVLHTPGHTPGSCCFLTENNLFTGDTFFASGPGTADRSYSSKSKLEKSIQYLRSTIQNLPNSPLIYPGHEEFGFALTSQ